MRVKIVERTRIVPVIVEVEIADNCPQCGNPRGKPYGFNFYEDGESYFCHRWLNPCGHLDLYSRVLKEAME